MEVCYFDPAKEWDKKCEQEEKEASGRAVCGYCDETIWEDYCFEINGEYYHEECAKSLYMMNTPVDKDF